MKYLKTIIFEFIVLLVLTLLTTIFYYFNLIDSGANNIFKIISFIVIFILTGIYIGKNSTKKGWLEGLKISGINILLFLIIALISRYGFNLRQFIYYLILTLTTVLGSMAGINFRKKK